MYYNILYSVPIMLLSTLIMNFVSHHIDFSVLIMTYGLYLILHKTNYHGRQNDIMKKKIKVYDIVFSFLKY